MKWRYLCYVALLCMFVWFFSNVTILLYFIHLIYIFELKDNIDTNKSYFQILKKNQNLSTTRLWFRHVVLKHYPPYSLMNEHSSFNITVLILLFSANHTSTLDMFHLFCTPQYSWNIAKVGIKHQSINPFVLLNDCTVKSVYTKPWINCKPV